MPKSETHIHIAPDGSIYEHSHEVEEVTYEDIVEEMLLHTHDHVKYHSHGPARGLSEKEQKAVLNRLSRATGHLESIRRMVEDGRDCTEILVQLAAVRSAINNTGKVILKDHIQSCMTDAVKSGNTAALTDLTEAIDRFMK